MGAWYGTYPDDQAQLRVPGWYVLKVARWGRVLRKVRVVDCEHVKLAVYQYVCIWLVHAQQIVIDSSQTDGHMATYTFKYTPNVFNNWWFTILFVLKGLEDHSRNKVVKMWVKHPPSSNKRVRLCNPCGSENYPQERLMSIPEILDVRKQPGKSLIQFHVCLIRTRSFLPPCLCHLDVQLLDKKLLKSTSESKWTWQLEKSRTGTSAMPLTK